MVNSQFDKYIGRKALVNETKNTMKLFGKDHEYVHCELDDNDTVVAEIKKEHSNVRVWLPGTIGTMEYNTGRLNVHIEKQADASYEVTKVSVG